MFDMNQLWVYSTIDNTLTFKEIFLEFSLAILYYD